MNELEEKWNQKANKTFVFLNHLQQKTKKYFVIFDKYSYNREILSS